MSVALMTGFAGALLQASPSQTLMSREDLFCIPPCATIRVDPDARRLAYLGSHRNGALNLFLSKDLTLTDARCLTTFEDPDIDSFYWSPDGKKIILLKDKNGTRQFHLYIVDVEAEHATDLMAAFKDGAAKVFCLSNSLNKAMIGINARNPEFYDLYQLDFATEKLTHVYQNDHFIKFVFNDQLEIVAKERLNPDGSHTVLDANDRLIFERNIEDSFHTECLAYNPHDLSLLLIDNLGCDTTQLKTISLKNPQERTVLGHDPRSDIYEVICHGDKPIAYTTYFIQKQWYALDKAVEPHLQYLEKHLGSGFEVLNQSKDGLTWVIRTSVPDQGVHFWLYQRATQQLQHLYAPSEGPPLAKMYPLVVNSSDGLSLVSYLTLPPEHDQGGRPDTPLPLVVLPHGGPFMRRDVYEYDPYHQWLANRGYAVLSVNFRLSTGFGKSFITAGNGQWGKKAHQDILDAVQWCVDAGIAQKEKTAILGSSYGGYEALAAVAFTP